jgi:hypothetical protein
MKVRPRGSQRVLEECKGLAVRPIEGTENLPHSIPYGQGSRFSRHTHRFFSRNAPHEGMQRGYFSNLGFKPLALAGKMDVCP